MTRKALSPLRTGLLLTALPAMLAACSLSQGPADETRPMTSAADMQDGWRSLFNGRDLTGWRGYKKASASTKWRVEDGALTLEAGGGAGDIVSQEEFGEFELSLDWKISEGGNSGIIYLVKEADGASQTYNTGLEMQVLDNDRHPDGKLASHRAGALYDLEAPSAPMVRPVGEWNSARILVHNGRVEHWLNGVKVVDTSYGDEAWRTKVAGSKFASMPLFGTFSRGHIALQDHSDQVWYRNIRIRTLD
jgi:hypothetical protein